MGSVGLCLLAALGIVIYLRGTPISASGPSSGIVRISEVQVVPITGRGLTDVAALEFEVSYPPEYGEVASVSLHPSLEDAEMGYSVDATAGMVNVVLIAPGSLADVSRLLDLEFSLSDGACAKRRVNVQEVSAFNVLGAEICYDSPGEAPKLAMAGDVDQDGFVDVRDLRLVATAFGKTEPDLNGDNLVDIVDLVLVGLNFDQAC